MALDATIVLAFIAGVVSFLSPCVLPIVPGFLAYLTGATLHGKADRTQTFLNSLFFVIGFSVVFSILGILLNTLLSGAAYETQQWLSRIGGAIIIAFGLHLVGLLDLPFLQKERKFSVKTTFNSRYATSFLFGAAFAVGWTPCVGAVLGSILALAASQPASAFALLLAYSLGLGLPFLLVGLFTARAAEEIKKHGKVMQRLTVAFGVLLILLGILVFTQNLPRVANLDAVSQLLR